MTAEKPLQVAAASGDERGLDPQRGLLRAIAQDASNLDLSGWKTTQIQRLADAGLGPILHRLAGARASHHTELLHGADLTARLVAGRMADALEEILRALGPAAAEVVLLKGAAAALRHYPQPHLRVMGDMDLLVPPSLYARLTALLGELGYMQTSILPTQFFETHHHAMPFWHPQKRLWVEVHHALFPPSWSCAAEPCFAVDTALAGTVPLIFRGITARALADELHLFFTCAHWAGSFSLERGLVALVDVIYLFKRGRPLDWDAVVEKAPGGWARRSLGLMLGYLSTHGAIDLPPRAAAFVADGLGPLGGINRRLLYWLLDTCLLGRRSGRLLTEPNVRNVWETLLLREAPAYTNLLQLPLVLLFPPNRQDRFSPMLAVRRLRSFLRGGNDS